MVVRNGLDALFSSRVKAFSNVLERHLPEVGLHCKDSLALHFGECWASEGARKLEVGKRCGGVLMLVHVVVLLLYWAS